ncbi:MAG: response regulator transcription factor [Cyclobacteriaceae bacterium]|nr:response regulator transcription factor [Cyclobacteriaceae bacterium]
MIRILLVEDDPSLGFVIKDKLAQAGYDTVLAENGEQGISHYKKEKFDLVILDVMLPKKDGFTLAEEIRRHDSEIPIFFLSAKALLEDRLKAFAKGGDDYISKPFSMEELIMKIKIFLRRSTAAKYPESKINIGLYSFDPGNYELILKDQKKILTIRESEVLKMLCENKNKIVKRQEILLKVWGDDDYFLGRSLDVFISRLRKYLDHDSNVSIDNIRGIGFILKVNNSPDFPI